MTLDLDANREAARARELMAGRDWRGASAVLDQALIQFPDRWQLWAMLGASRHALGERPIAIAAFSRSLQLAPDTPSVLNALATVLVEEARLDEALEAMNRAVALAPSEARTLFNRGLVLERMGRPEPALADYDGALTLDPGFVPALMSRGAALMTMGRFDLAVANNRQLVALQPASADACFNLAEALLGLGCSNDALDACDRALALDARHTLAHIDRGLALADLGRIESAQQSLDRARDLDPTAFHNFRAGFAPKVGGVLEQFDARSLYLHRLYEEQEVCNWRRRRELVERLEGLVLQGAASGNEIADPYLPFRALGFPISREASQKLAQAVAKRLRAGAPRLPRQKPASGRIRIAYVSPDFGVHPGAFLTRRMYGLHDRNRFEVFAYALAADDGSAVRKDIVAGVDCFREVAALSPAQIAEQIHRDGIHIAIDLSGYTNRARSEIFAFEPAPVQVNYLGFPGSLGAGAYKYAIVDGVICPPGEDRWWTERLVYMPDTYYVTDNQTRIAPVTIGRRDAGLPQSGFVFCCFNNSYKIGPDIFDVWMRILARVPGAVLWLLGRDPKVESNLRREADRRGIDGKRIVVGPFLPREVHLARYPLAGLFLDTPHYNAHTTAVDALWMGVPVLTCPGSTMPSRVGASLLRAAGLPEGIVRDLREYEETAVRLATGGSSELSLLKTRLAQNRSSCALFDTATFVRHLEKAYELMWARESQGLPPESFRVPRVERAIPPHRRWH